MEDWEKKQVFQKNTEEERIQLLTDNADHDEFMTVRRDFSQKEIKDKKDEHAEISILLRDEEIKKKVFMDNFKAVTKPLIHENSILVKHMKDGFIDEEKLVWALDNQEDGVMEFYDAKGNCVMQRALLQRERQLKLIPRTGTHGE